MTPHKLLESKPTSSATQAQLDAYLASREGAKHAHFHDMLQTELRMPPVPKLSLTVEEMAHAVQKRTRRKANIRRAGQVGGGMVMVLSLCAVVLLWFAPQSAVEPTAFEAQTVVQPIDLWDMQPQMKMSEFAAFDQTIDSVQAQIELPLNVPETVPVGFEYVGAAYNSWEISADIAFSERAANRVWILSQRDLAHYDDLLSTVVGPRLTAIRYTQSPIELGVTTADFSNYSYGQENDQRFQTVDWTTNGRQMRLTIYAVEYVSAETILETLTQLNMLPAD